MPESVSEDSRGSLTSTHSDEAERSLVLLSQFASAAAFAPSPKPELVGNSAEGETGCSWPLVRSAVETASISVSPALAIVGSVTTGYWAVSVVLSSTGCSSEVS